MRTERRTAARRLIDLPVYIRYRKRRFLAAQARNIAVGGMFLDVQSLTLPVGTPVELEFRQVGHGWLIPGIVIRGNSQGIGVMFRDAQPDLLRELTQLGAPMSVPPAAREGADRVLTH